jgi:hypothetical protein
VKRALILSVLLLAACGSSEDAPDDAATATPVAAEPSALSLEPLQNGDGSVVADNMSNVGGCGFYDKDGRNLLSVGIPDNYGLAEGAGGPAIGVARPNGEQTKFTAEKADAGFIESGPKLSGGGFTLTVLRAEGEGKPLDREEVEYAADSRTYSPGGWRCGV